MDEHLAVGWPSLWPGGSTGTSVCMGMGWLRKCTGASSKECELTQVSEGFVQGRKGRPTHQGSGGQNPPHRLQRAERPGKKASIKRDLFLDTRRQLRTVRSL